MRAWAIGVSLVALVVTTAVLARLRWLRRAVPTIPPLSERHYRFAGVDDGARRRSDARRLDAERKVSDANRIRTRDDASALLHRVS
jgi:hypothetical protein